MPFTSIMHMTSNGVAKQRSDLQPFVISLSASGERFHRKLHVWAMGVGYV